MEKIKSELRVQGVQAVADKFKERDELIREAVSAHGITLQSDPMTQPPPQLSSDNQVPADKADAVKERIIAKVESMLPAVEESGPGRRIAADVLRESVESASLGNTNEEGQMGARLLAEVAKQAGVNWEEMERLIEFTEKDAEKRQELRALVKEAMIDVKQRPQESIAQPGT